MPSRDSSLHPSCSGAFSSQPRAQGFSFYGPTQDPALAARLDSRALADGVQVGVAPGFAASFGATTPDEVLPYEQIVRDAFAAWESPALHFDITFGSVSGAEIVLQGQTGADPLLGFYGLASASWRFYATRLLTNGTTAAGYVIASALVQIASERMLTAISLLGEDYQRYAIQRLLMHEVGHALGLGHTNDPTLLYYDTDTDPTNPIVIDPMHPTAGLITSPNRFRTTIMSNWPCGTAQFCGALFATSLSNDDRGGRDVLYPFVVPEPAVGALLLASLVALALGQTIQRAIASSTRSTSPRASSSVPSWNARVGTKPSSAGGRAAGCQTPNSCTPVRPRGSPSHRCPKRRT
jgi:hypothetical protein